MNDNRNLLARDLQGQTRVLKRLAKGDSLEDILQTLVEVAEESRPEMIASILLVDRETGCLRMGAARQLPKFYMDACEGLMPGPSVGSCGTAAYTGKRVIVTDIDTDPLWSGVREFAQRASLRACWSEPIIGSTGEVLGTLAMYYKTPRAPEQSELEFVSSSANLAALAIERVRHQREVEGERALLKTIVGGIPDALISSSLDRKITHYNASAAQLFGYAATEAMGMPTLELYANSDDYHRLGSFPFKAAHAPVLAATEVEWKKKSGETFPGEIVATTIRDEQGKSLGYLGLIRDITDRKAAEAKLAESQRKLVQAERLAAMGEMVSAIAHESRNALQRIQVCVDILQYEMAEDAEARDDLDRISHATTDLQRLHEELCNYAGPIQLDISQGDLSEVWQKAWKNLQVSRTDRDARLCEQIDTVDLKCPMDAFRIEQVFRNLFENSLAACEDPVRICISCRNVEVDGVPSLSIQVRDNGPGLPEEIRPLVFEAFHTTKAKGTGLGMAVAKRFLEAHKGSIAIGNDHGDGAEFVMTLPRELE
ncbi:Sensor protein FixL [Roseimaritima multifibrata]|uniref:histidine kinase n=1 Tax=Roseimaritima multifibrata TaxID=1930274 RepID=A0A517MDR1_9BACT|nr:GAF domain-containing protein [Roseimaritima multifibrata]QDS93025.1 Sensor protein FixL [Roseimaritima multifibrata]